RRRGGRGGRGRAGGGHAERRIAEGAERLFQRGGGRVHHGGRGGRRVLGGLQRQAQVEGALRGGGLLAENEGGDIGAARVVAHALDARGSGDQSVGGHLEADRRFVDVLIAQSRHGVPAAGQDAGLGAIGG